MTVGSSGTVTSSPPFFKNEKFCAQVLVLESDNQRVRATADGKHVASARASGGVGGLKEVTKTSGQDKITQERNAVVLLAGNIDPFEMDAPFKALLSERHVQYISHKFNGKEFLVGLSHAEMSAMTMQAIIKESKSKISQTLHKYKNINVNKEPVLSSTSKSKTLSLKGKPKLELSPQEIAERMISVDVEPSLLIEGVTLAVRYIQLVPRKAPISPPKPKLSVDDMLMIPKDIPAANILNPFKEESKSTPDILPIYPQGELRKAQQQQEDAEEAAALVGLEVLDLAPPPEFADDESGISTESTEQATGQHTEQAIEATAEELAEINEQRKRDADEFEEWYAKQQQKKHQ